MGEKIVLSVQNIVKCYPGVVALDHVSLEFREGEIHALMGENGAGKSTLMSIISGAQKMDQGTIRVNGAVIDHMSIQRSKELGIAIIYQELMMVPELSVAENVFLGSAVRNGPFVNRNAMEKKTSEIFDSLGIHINPKIPVSKLTVAYRQMVEIARALSKNVKILIMDEPSATLTDDEVEILMKLILKLKESGVTVIYISHRIEEVFRIADRISILRDGKYITTLQTSQTNKEELIHYMVGRDLKETFPEKDCPIGKAGLEIKHFTGNGVSDISFTVHHGEILGLGGLIGAGRTELAQLIFGAASLESGELYLDGEKVVIKSPKEAVGHGLALIPEDRKQQGLVLDSSVEENILLPSLPRLSRMLLIKKSKARNLSQNLRQSLDIKTPSLGQKTRNLSGGNQQKVVLAKWLGAQCGYLIFDEPTRGIDVGAKQEIYRLLNQLASEGKCILMISSEMEELIGISDRIIVLCEGHMTGELQKSEFNQDKILSMASGY